MEIPVSNIEHLHEAMNNLHDFLIWTCKSENKAAYDKAQELNLFGSLGIIAANIEMLSDFKVKVEI